MAATSYGQSFLERVAPKTLCMFLAHRAAVHGMCDVKTELYKLAAACKGLLTYSQKIKQ